MKKFSLTTTLCAAAAALFLTACGGEDTSASATTASTDSAATAPKTLKVGVCPGPYGPMLERIFKPILQEQGYELTVIEFTDYVQPNLALDGGDLDANLMQHKAYLDTFVQTQGVKLESATSVPTLGMGVFAQKVKSFNEIDKASGGTAAIPNDAVNLARALRLARDLNLITLTADLDENKASTADIDQNFYNLEFVPMEAAQISRSLDSVTIGFIPGNYAYAAHLDYGTALGIEQVAEDIKNVVAVRQNDPATKELLFKVVQSPEFKERINNDNEFKLFTKPEWWDKVGAASADTAAPAPAPAAAPAADADAAETPAA